MNKQKKLIDCIHNLQEKYPNINEKMNEDIREILTAVTLINYGVKKYFKRIIDNLTVPTILFDITEDITKTKPVLLVKKYELSYVYDIFRRSYCVHINNYEYKPIQYHAIYCNMESILAWASNETNNKISSVEDAKNAIKLFKIEYDKKAEWIQYFENKYYYMKETTENWGPIDFYMRIVANNIRFIESIYGDRFPTFQELMNIINGVK